MLQLVYTLQIQRQMNRHLHGQQKTTCRAKQAVCDSKFEGRQAEQLKGPLVALENQIVHAHQQGITKSIAQPAWQATHCKTGEAVTCIVLTSGITTASDLNGLTVRDATHQGVIREGCRKVSLAGL